MEHFTTNQKRQFIIEESSKLAAQGRQTIDHKTATLLLGKLGFDVKNSQVSDLLDDANMLSDGYIDQDSTQDDDS